MHRSLLRRRTNNFIRIHCAGCADKSSNLITIDELISLKEITDENTENTASNNRLSTERKLKELMLNVIGECFPQVECKDINSIYLCEECAQIAYDTYSKFYASNGKRLVDSKPTNTQSKESPQGLKVSKASGQQAQRKRSAYDKEDGPTSESEEEEQEDNSSIDSYRPDEEEEVEENEEENENYSAVTTDDEEEGDGSSSNKEESAGSRPLEDDPSTSGKPRSSSSRQKRPHACVLCEKRFIRSTQLKNHMMIEHPQEGIECDYKCMICDLEFTRKYNLQRHLKKIHNLSEDKMHRVQTVYHKLELASETENEAQKTAAKRKRTAIPDNSLQREKEKWISAKTSQSVPEEMEFRCSHCNRVFYRRHYLKRHLEIHKSTKTQYVCDICGKSYTRKDTLASHKRELHSESKYECSVCLKMYATTRQLAKHLKIHLKKPKEHL